MTTLLDETAAIAQEEVQHARVASTLDRPPAKRGETPITGGDGSLRYPTPMWGEYTKDYAPAPDLEAIGEALIHEYEELEHLLNARIAYFWANRKGGKGCKLWGSVTVANGVPGHFTKSDFVLVMNAKSLTSMTAAYIENALYHLLRHAEWNPGKKKGRWFVSLHEFAGFKAEIDHYGMWQGDPLGIVDSFKQLKLGETAAEPAS